MKFKFILSDLDGVIRHYPIERNSKIEKKYNLPEGSILKTAFEKESLNQAVCGKISDDDWRKNIEVSLAKISDAKTAMLAMQEWNDFSGMVDQDYLEYLKTKFANTPVAILTNGTTRLNKDLTKLKLDKYFYTIFNSADIGCCKPDAKIFEYILHKLKCRLLFAHRICQATWFSDVSLQVVK
jgi:HAD superfamily hydrolase (TIGR01549 family)